MVDGQPREPFYVDAVDDAVRRIDVLGATIRTAEGVGVGTTLADLQADVPGARGTVRRPGLAGVVAVRPDRDARLRDPGRRGRPAARRHTESVILMRVLAAGVDPAFATANSGDVAGACG